ncbi:hypothetical protein [Streptomyces hokutonensis]|uniref:hypothetical protein n=1 Tax=Streptomyces hokutonensis TaxID=1306990 RepID=UPI0037FBB996
MNNQAPAALILGGTGRTGSLLAADLTRAGIVTRTASRHGADVRFDWDDRATHANALSGVDRLYLVPPSCAWNTPPRSPTSWTSPRPRGYATSPS